MPDLHLNRVASILAHNLAYNARKLAHKLMSISRFHINIRARARSHWPPTSALPPLRCGAISEAAAAGEGKEEFHAIYSSLVKKRIPRVFAARL